ncbi:OmpA family protein [Pedobacter steynii]|uniref:OmpA family protein n=1 Tax=Pedobacter steynii TaxID=430522 RepID=A0A1G9UHT2_9SPHI|nr:OmpA family protein [Pedobacter steynii]NQX40762.1 OmpA family protein [Pedobacter steynii]SDM59095.1 OmpA family protein [Pedobacter steynii]
MATKLFAMLILICTVSHAQINTREIKRNAEGKVSERLNKGVNAGIDVSAEPQQNSDILRKFDFVQGDKILIVENFSQDNLGDFPAKWSTNSGGEIVELNGEHWLNVGKNGVFMPQFINNLPDNFTFEFDVTSSANFNFYSNPLSFAIAELANPNADYVKWKQFNRLGRNGIEVGIHPKSVSTSNSKGTTNYQVYTNGNYGDKNKAMQNEFISDVKPTVHVSIWRQKNRLRIYLNQEKIWDLPTAFVEGKKYNSILFQTGNFKKEEDKYYINNLRLAVGNPDTRNKLINEGKFVSSGILFDVNSATIKPESYGLIKSIAVILQENPAVKIKIIGHTDSDGDDKDNLKLSKQRADALKIMLSRDFGINATRMQTDGKGESIPAMPNTSEINKANNRRVEFIKIK